MKTKIPVHNVVNASDPIGPKYMLLLTMRLMYRSHRSDS